MRRAAQHAQPLAGLDDVIVRMPDGRLARNPPGGLMPEAWGILEALVEDGALPESEVAHVRRTRFERQVVLGSDQWTLDAPRDLSNWGQVLHEAGVDAAPAASLAALAARGALGHAEASRILAHLFKPGPSKSTPSKYLFMAIQDAERYLEDWRLYEAERPGAARGPSGWCRLRHSRGEKPDPSSSWTQRSSGWASSSSQAPQESEDAWSGFCQGRWAESRAEPPAGPSGASSSWQDPSAPPGPSGGASGSSGNPGHSWSA